MKWWLVKKFWDLRSGECPVPKKWRWPAVGLVVVVAVLVVVWP